MTSDALFDVADPDPRRKHQACGRCLTVVWRSDDRLRASGWLVFDGTSEADKELHVRICPKCQTTKGKGS